MDFETQRKFKMAIIPISVIVGAILGFFSFKKWGATGATLTVIATLGVGALFFIFWDPKQSYPQPQYPNGNGGPRPVANKAE